MTTLYWLDQIRPQQLALVGWKAFYLSQVWQNGGSVIPGFVISAEVLKSFLEQMSWTIPLFADLPGSALRVNIGNARQLQAIAQDLQQAITAAPLPPQHQTDLSAAIAQLASPVLILRPSLMIQTEHQATLAACKEAVWQSSGLLDSRVVAAHEDAVTAGLKQVWANLFNAKSLFYWQRLGVSLQQVNLAVLVQPIQSAIAAGVLRSRGELLELESTVGLGTAIARGEVIPDRYLLSQNTGQLLSKQRGERSLAYQIESADLQVNWFDDTQPQIFSLPDDTLPRFAAMMQQATQSLNCPVMLEWVLPLSPQDATSPLITQVIPQLPTPLGPVDPEPPVTGARRTPELFPGATLLATGLPASGGQAIAPALVIPDLALPPDEILPHTIWIAPNIPLNWIPHIAQATGLVSEQGSLTSHSAIVARELGVPAVMGVANISQHVQSGELLWVDGDRGRVYRLQATTPIPETLPPPKSSTLPSRHPHRPPLHTQLMVNLSQPEQVSQIAHLPVDGVGLLRAELLAMGLFDGQHPRLWLQAHSPTAYVEHLATAIAQFAAAFYPRPVFYRTLDVRSHELDALTPSAAQPEAAMGIRGTFSYQLDDKLFTLELQALQSVQQMGYTNLRLLLPFVRTVAEFEFCHQRVQQIGLMAVEEFQIWMMAEVPSVIWLLPEFVVAGVQGISIGTNDLTQLLLGVNRDHALLSHSLNEQNLAVQRAIAQLIEAARSLNLPCSICGEAPVRYPALIADWVQGGIQSISVAPEAVEPTYEAILRAEQQRRSRKTEPDQP